MAIKCAVCSKELGFFHGKVQLKDTEHVCMTCWANAGFNSWGDVFEKSDKYTTQDIIKFIKENKKRDSVITDFVSTLDVCPAAKFNDDTRQVILADNVFVYTSFDPQKKRAKNYTLFSYDQIIGFELLENGESITSGGIGRAALGGALFGGVGAIVGASTRSYKSVCQELKIKITVNDYTSSAFYIPLISHETKKSSNIYKERMKMAQDILSKFQLIANTNTNETNSKEVASKDKFEEIRKYKALFDEGIISEEEFENKKKELLNL